MGAKDLELLQRTIDELTVFNEIGRTLTSSLEIDQVLARIMDRITGLLKPKNWSLLLLDEASQELHVQVVVGGPRKRKNGATIRVGEGIAGWVAREKRSLLLPDAQLDPRFHPLFDRASDLKPVTVLCAPMISKEKVLGVIELMYVQEGAPRARPADLTVLETIADYAAIAIENARNFRQVQELTNTDDVTGLYNSRFLQRVLEYEVARASRYQTPLSLVFVDLDRFKEVNDRWGHLHGSRLLFEVGQVIRDNLRKTDFGVRYGGDEFVALLPQTAKENAMVLVKRLHREIGRRTFLVGGPPPGAPPTSIEGPPGGVRLSASFGIAEYPRDAQSAEELLRMADTAMYGVKKTTRDGIGTA